MWPLLILQNHGKLKLQFDQFGVGAYIRIQSLQKLAIICYWKGFLITILIFLEGKTKTKTQDIV